MIAAFAMASPIGLVLSELRAEIIARSKLEWIAFNQHRLANLAAQFDTLIANENGRSSDEIPDLRILLPAK